HGRGRVVQFASGLTRELAGWNAMGRLHAGLLGYLAALPHRDLVALAEAAEPDSLAALDGLADAYVEAVPRQDGDTAVVELHNPSPALAFMVHLDPEPEAEMAGAAPLLFSDNFLCLFPGERRTVRVRRDPEAPAADGRFRLVLRGWNLAPRPLDRPLVLRDGQLALGKP
ncbi:MAG: glycoside hydrolase family 2 protein, partial [Planctomycetota bacterium]